MRTLRLAALSAVTAFVLTGCLQGSTPTANVGDCLDVGSLATVVETLPTVPCDEPHEAEVYAVLDLESDAAYEDLAVDEVAFDECEALFADFIGVAYEESVIEIWYLYPDTTGWGAGDREVICAAAELDWDTGDVVPVTGTLADANR
jgi:hypothetical protein